MLPERIPREFDDNHPEVRPSRVRHRWAGYIPNVLTGFRILLAGVFPMASDSFRPWVILVALVTEALDGTLSRWLHAETLLGQILDPIADKLFFGSVTVTFLIEGKLTVLQLLLLGIRDVGVTFSVGLSVLQKNWNLIKNMKPRFFGKLVTALQYVAFANLVFMDHLSPAVLAITATIGILAGVQYTFQYMEAKGAKE